MVKFPNLRSKPYIIAEIGINHNGIFSIAKKLILNSKKAGADAVKFQKRDVSDLVNFNTSPGYSKGYLSKNERDIKKKNTKFGSWVYPDTRLELSSEDISYLRVANSPHVINILNRHPTNSLDDTVKKE